MLRSDPDENLKLDEQNSLIPNSSLTTPKMMIELATESYVDSLHENSRNRRDWTTVFTDQDSEFDDSKLKNLDSFIVRRYPNSDKELANKKNVDDSLGEGSFHRFFKSLKNFLKVSFGDTVYNPVKTDKIQITGITIFNNPNNGGYLLQQWTIRCIDRNRAGNIQKFTKSTKTSSPTTNIGAISIRPIGDAFVYIKTSPNNFGNGVICSIEGTDIIQISIITFYYKRSLAGCSKSMGRFRIQLLIEDGTWSTR